MPSRSVSILPGSVCSACVWRGPSFRAGAAGGCASGRTAAATPAALGASRGSAEVGTDHESPGSPALLGVTEDFLLAAGAASREDFPPLLSLVSEEELSRVREHISRASGEPPPAGSPHGSP